MGNKVSLTRNNNNNNNNDNIYLQILRSNISNNNSSASDVINNNNNNYRLSEEKSDCSVSNVSNSTVSNVSTTQTVRHMAYTLDNHLPLELIDIVGEYISSNNDAPAHLRKAFRVLGISYAQYCATIRNRKAMRVLGIIH